MGSREFLKRISTLIIIMLSSATMALEAVYYLPRGELYTLSMGVLKIAFLTLLFTLMFPWVERVFRGVFEKLVASSIALVVACALSYTLNPWVDVDAGRVLWIELYTLASILYWVSINAGALAITPPKTGVGGGVSGRGSSMRGAPASSAGLERVFSKEDVIGAPLELSFKKTSVSRTGIEGYRIAGYVVRGFIGAGGLTVALLGEDEEGSVYVAKIPRSVYEALSTGDTVKAQVVDPRVFEREASLLKRLSHPHITRFFECGVEYGVPYVIVEYCGNGSLRGVLELMGRVGVRESLVMCAQIADALSYMHSLGVVHGDLKPENILFSSEGVLKLTDIIYPRMIQGYEGGGRFFTIGYASPEQIFDGVVNEYSDVWSLGVILYEAITGKRPFRRECYAEDVRSLSIDYSGVPERVAWVIEQMLSIEPESRPRASEARDMILEALASLA